ncbi:MAG: UTP--glucose-1-phosphate uridylyltransferase, partial [bacterium]
MKIRKAVFPAAGLGTRFLPATKAQPKEMLTLVDKPLIQYVIEEAVAAGLTKIVIVTGRGKSSIEDHFDVSYELEQLLEARGKTDLLEQVRAISNMINVSYVRQGEALGLGHAVLVARDLVGEEPFAVMLGDDIVDSAVPCMKQMVDVFERFQAPVVALQQVPRDEISAYGVIQGTLEPGSDRVYRIHDLVEKPSAAEAPSDLAIIG